jgi:hypothetical protein
MSRASSWSARMDCLRFAHSGSSHSITCRTRASLEPLLRGYIVLPEDYRCCLQGYHLWDGHACVVSQITHRNGFVAHGVRMFLVPALLRTNDWNIDDVLWIHTFRTQDSGNFLQTTDRTSLISGRHDRP